MPVFCEVCGEPCRGTCSKCGARLCVRHKQSSPRARCLVCSGRPTPQTAKQTRMAATPAFKPALTPQGTPYYTPTRQPIYTPPSKRLEDMTETEALIHFEDLRARLLKKQKREREYLDRRAARGTHTPTDEAYEADQLLEDELIELLDRAIKSAPH